MKLPAALGWVYARHALAAPLGLTPHGGYGYERTGPGRGACPHGYPCRHWGEDWRPRPGDGRVLAPERCVVVALGTDAPPLTGYGVTAALVRGWSVWHVLGDLASLATGLRVGDALGAGDLVGECDAFCHWEVRTQERPPTGAERGAWTMGASAWLARRHLVTAAAVAGAVGVGLLVARPS